jgi:RNA polymerase sigma factor (sigma-70 family)
MDRQQMLEDALTALAETQGTELAGHIRPVLLANLARDRIPFGEVGSLQAYVQRVAENYKALHLYLHDLQAERSHAVWAPLYQKMQVWAFNYFFRIGFRADQNTREIAIECASDAAANLLTAYYPYDTEFDAWAHAFVLNFCRKFIQKNLRKSMVPEDKNVELDEELADPNAPLLGLDALQSEFGEDLEEALSRLSESRRAVIRFVFFDGLEPEEIAQRMGKSVSAIYTLQFHGLRDLRKILTAIRDNLHE